MDASHCQVVYSDCKVADCMAPLHMLCLKLVIAPSCMQDRALLHNASSEPTYPKTFFFSTNFATALWKVRVRYIECLILQLTAQSQHPSA